MPASIRVALAADLLLISIQYVCPGCLPFLPLGGNHLVQLGALLCVGIAFDEISGVRRPR